jgi:Tol biopolymer transport system component
MVLDTETGILTNLTHNAANDAHPACSPDGHLAFASDRSGDYEIYSLDLSTAIVQNLTNSPNSNELDPAWSRDGYLAYTTSYNNGYHLVVMDISTGKSEIVTHGSARAYDPAWSSSGYLAYAYVADNYSKSDIYLIDWEKRLTLNISCNDYSEDVAPGWISSE